MQIRHAKPGDETQLAFLLGTISDTTAMRWRTAPARRTRPILSSHRLAARSAWSPTTVASSWVSPFSIPPGPRFTHGLYLKELYVAAAARSVGVGAKLIEGIRALAKERGDTRVLRTTTEDNVGAQRFYDRLRMRREKKVYYAMDV